MRNVAIRTNFQINLIYLITDSCNVGETLVVNVFKSIMVEIIHFILKRLYIDPRMNLKFYTKKCFKISLISSKRVFLINYRKTGYPLTSFLNDY